MMIDDNYTKAAEHANHLIVGERANIEFCELDALDSALAELLLVGKGKASNPSSFPHLRFADIERVFLLVDSQCVIDWILTVNSCVNDKRIHSIVATIHSKMRRVLGLDASGNLEFYVLWVHSHAAEPTPANELVDILAKMAVNEAMSEIDKDSSDAKGYAAWKPVSFNAVKNEIKQTVNCRVKQSWKHSLETDDHSYSAHMKGWRLPNVTVLKLEMKSLSMPYFSKLMRLRSGHCEYGKYKNLLMGIMNADTKCRQCKKDNTIIHKLLYCPSLAPERRDLMNCINDLYNSLEWADAHHNVLQDANNNSSNLAQLLLSPFFFVNFGSIKNKTKLSDIILRRSEIQMAVIDWVWKHIVRHPYL